MFNLMTSYVSEETDTECVLVVEDDAAIRRMIVDSLQLTGVVIEEAPDGKTAFRKLRDGFYDLVLLDLKLSDVNGMEILRTIRRHDEFMPVIVVSSTQDVDTKVGGFEAGCDDYVTKPFHPSELVGRVNRILRRCRRCSISDGPERPTIDDYIVAGPFSLNLQEHQVYKEDRPIPMRKKLFDLMYLLCQNANTVVSQATLIERLWENQTDYDKNTVYVHIHQLRTLIEEDPSHPRYIQTVRGLGFRLSVS